MFELFMLFGLLFAGWIVIHLFFAIFKISFWALTLPFQILAGLLGLFLALVLIVPLGLFAGLVGLLAIPIGLIVSFAPFIIIGIGVYLLLKD